MKTPRDGSSLLRLPKYILKAKGFLLQKRLTKAQPFCDFLKDPRLWNLE
jgi:hypothetical protein